MRLKLLAAATLLATCLTARADQFTFSTNLSTGTVTGVLQGTFTLASVMNHGSGSGAATAFTFTTIPAGFGSLSGGNVATSWADQVSNSFSVVNGIVTSALFFATTAADDPANVVCINSTVTLPAFGIFVCPTQINELHANGSLFGYNSSGLAGITFNDVSPTSTVTPEPSSIALLGTGVLGIAGIVRRRTL